MSDMSAWLRFVLAVLATWRITHLLANEDGPAALLARLRERLGGGLAGRLMDCFHCLSFWVAAPLAFFVSGNPLELLLTWLALSGGACLLERFGQEPIALQPMSHTTEGETHDGMLRSEASSLQEHSLADDNAGRHAPRTK